MSILNFHLPLTYLVVDRDLGAGKTNTSLSHKKHSNTIYQDMSKVKQYPDRGKGSSPLRLPSTYLVHRDLRAGRIDPSDMGQSLLVNAVNIKTKDLSKSKVQCGQFGFWCSGSTALSPFPISWKLTAKMAKGWL